MGDNTDQTLIRFYGVKSPDEIAEMVGIPAIDIAKRTEEALGRRDYLGEAARIQILMGKLEDMANEIQQRLPDMSDRNISAAVNSASGAMGRVLGQLTKIQAMNKVDLDAVHTRYAQEMVRIVEASYNRQLGRLAERYPEIPQEDLEAEFQELVLAVSKESDSA